jgi:hypothetical protein
LKQWKFERVLPCALEEYLDVVDDHKDEGDSDDEDDQSNEDGDESDETGSSNYQSDEAIFM